MAAGESPTRRGHGRPPREEPPNSPSAQGGDRDVPASDPPPETDRPASDGPSLGRLISGVIRTVRPHQWVKNLFVVAPVVFAKHLTHPSIIKGAIGAFGIFCIVSGAIYTLNDILDVEADRVHPVKRRRPIASGDVPVGVAKALLVVLLATAFGAALIGPREFLAVAFGYFVLNVAYSLRLKKIAYLDVGCIAAGFVLRVLGGGFATRTPVSWYMIACTLFLALFLGFGKRVHELGGENAAKQRAALKAYSPRALFWLMAGSGIAAVATYVAYTLAPHTKEFFRTEWLWATAIHPLFGVLRFLQLVKDRPKAESPTQEMLKDVPFMLNLVIWVVEVIAIVYRLRPS
jgi:decaprenyl-phosphate phosphoribosyltransferase